jgi:hypothetical protein
MSNFKVIPLLPAVGIRAMSGAGLSRPAGLIGPGSAAGLAAGFHRRHVQKDMLLPDAEVQYVLSKCRSTIAR